MPEPTPNSQGIVFVIDSSNTSNLQTAKEELTKLFKNAELARSVFLILANKQDKHDCVSREQLIQNFELDSLERSDWAIFPVSVLQGTNLDDAFEWLLSSMQTTQYN